MVIGEQCRVCGCTELRPCMVRVGDGDLVEICQWMDADHTLCSAPPCIAQIPLSELEQMAGL